MMNEESLKKYKPTIGIECHVQLRTKTKLFAAVDNDARGKEPNATTSPICFGMPGALPYLNKEAVNLGIRAGLALNATIADFMKFDRKHYFYPDLPKGYQITQFDQPIIKEGHVEPSLDGEIFKVRVERAHLEEDAGKSTHPSGSQYTYVDLNRAGTPLLEIVSYPDMHSPEEARAYEQELYYLMKYADVSDVDLYHGNMRFDVNVSVAPVDSDELGTRTETKNLNSFRSVERATAFEIKRQIELIEKGEKIVQETRGWDDSKQKTFSQRTKEEAHDYRYFPEPDLPPVKIKQEQVESIEKDMPQLPSEIRQILIDANVDKSHVETLLGHPQLIELLLSIAEQDKTALKRIVNWFVVDVLGEVNARDEFDWSQHQLTADSLIALNEMMNDKKLSSNGATTVLIELLDNGGDPDKIAKDKNVIQMTDTSSIEAIVDQVINENEKAAQDVRDGEMKAIGFLVGQVMKQSQGQANPQVAKDLLLKKLS